MFFLILLGYCLLYLAKLWIISSHFYPCLLLFVLVYYTITIQSIMGSQNALGGIPPEEYRACITQVFPVKFMGLLSDRGPARNIPQIFFRLFFRSLLETKSVITARLSSNE